VSSTIAISPANGQRGNLNRIADVLPRPRGSFGRQADWRSLIRRYLNAL
jgi:hypothetical protein